MYSVTAFFVYYNYTLYLIFRIMIPRTTRYNIHAMILCYVSYTFSIIFILFFCLLLIIIFSEHLLYKLLCPQAHQASLLCRPCFFISMEFVYYIAPPHRHSTYWLCFPTFVLVRQGTYTFIGGYYMARQQRVTRM